MSSYRPAYVTLKLLAMNSIVFTGGITKVLSTEDIEDVVMFFYKKILNSDHKPVTVLDVDYGIWTLGASIGAAGIAESGSSQNARTEPVTCQ